MSKLTDIEDLLAMCLDFSKPYNFDDTFQMVIVFGDMLDKGFSKEEIVSAMSITGTVAINGFVDYEILSIEDKKVANKLLAKSFLRKEEVHFLFN